MLAYLHVHLIRDGKWKEEIGSLNTMQEESFTKTNEVFHLYGISIKCFKKQGKKQGYMSVWPVLKLKDLVLDTSMVQLQV